MWEAPVGSRRAGLWSMLPRSVDQQVHGVSSPQFSSLKFSWTGWCQSHPAPTLCGPDPAPQNTNAACSKVDSLPEEWGLFSFSYPCLGFYSTPIFIPSTLQNEPKQPLNSEDFFPIRWHDWVGCQPRELRVDVRAQNSVPLASVPPTATPACQGGERAGPNRAIPNPKQERHGPVAAAPPRVLPETRSSCHSVLPVAGLWDWGPTLSLWQGREWDPSHEPQRH